MRLNRIAFFTTLLSILCLGASFKVWADDEVETYGLPESHDFIKHRTYIGVFANSTAIDNNNDFNGTEVFTQAPITTITSGATVISNIEQDFVPAIDRNFGFTGMVGHREGPWAAELSYWLTNHTGSIYGTDAFGNPTTITVSAVLTSIDVDLKRYFFTTIPTQPFVDIGMNFTFLDSHNTSNVYSVNAGTGTTQLVSIGDQTDSGFGLNLGAGMEIYLGDGLSLVGGVMERWTSFSQISGQEKTPITPYFTNNFPTNTNGSIEGNGLNFYVGSTIGFDE
jgi:hypothetical protein